MSFALRKPVVLAARLKVGSQIFSRSLNMGPKMTAKNLLLPSVGLCVAGVTVAAWDKEPAKRIQSKVMESFQSFSSLVQSVTSLNSDDISKLVFGSVAAQKKSGSRSVGPCGGKQKKQAKNCMEPQQNVVTPNCMHSLYLWISVDSSADQCEVARVASDIDSLLCSVEDCEGNRGEDLVAGVGFGPSFYSQVMGKTCKNYYYVCRKCSHGELPAACGDILLHVKSSDRGKLFEVCKNYLYSFPESSIREYEDIYGFDYKCGRDVSNFRLQNPDKDEDGIKEIAVECETGGSYALAMKWVHDFSVMRPENKAVLEKYIGRDMQCGTELKCKTETCHLTRMRGSADEGATPCFEVTPQSMSYGSLSKGAGLFYLAFAKDPANHEFMLDRMVGSSCDGCHDDIFKISKNCKGKYFYFPGQDDLACLRTSGK